MEKMKNTISSIVRKFDSTNRNESGIIDMLSVIEAQVDCYAEFDCHVRRLDKNDIDKDKLDSQYKDISDYYAKKIKEIRDEKRKEKKNTKAEEHQKLEKVK